MAKDRLKRKSKQLIQAMSYETLINEIKRVSILRDLGNTKPRTQYLRHLVIRKEQLKKVIKLLTQ